MLEPVAYRLGSFVADLLFSPSRILGGEGLRNLRESCNYRPFTEFKDALSGEETQDFIRNRLLGHDPVLISRLGSTEARALVKYHNRQTRSKEELFYALFSRFEAPFWTRHEHRNLRKKTGFFPISRSSIDEFASEMFRAMGEVDLLGSWVPGENRLASFFSAAQFTRLEHLSPFGVEKPWTHALEGQRVLVIHPFQDSIEVQFKKRQQLFSNSEFLPSFSLDTMKAVQSLGTPPPEFRDWFQALNFMHEDTKSRDFDVALIACGSYGFPLGARLKRDGKKVIVLGGILQLLFGIMGKRWDRDGLYNDNWIRPMEAEKPDGFYGADRGAYW